MDSQDYSYIFRESFILSKLVVERELINISFTCFINIATAHAKNDLSAEHIVVLAKAEGRTSIAKQNLVARDSLLTAHACISKVINKYTRPLLMYFNS